jgi:hydrogenase/urease accessory protein HupE
MAEAVYVMCALTGAACAILLVRSYRRNRMRLLFWSAFCFIALALNSVLVIIDLIVVPETDLGVLRSVIALTGLGGLLFVLIWDTR